MIVEFFDFYFKFLTFNNFCKALNAFTTVLFFSFSLSNTLYVVFFGKSSFFLKAQNASKLSMHCFSALKLYSSATRESITNFLSFKIISLKYFLRILLLSSSTYSYFFYNFVLLLFCDFSVLSSLFFRPFLLNISTSLNIF